MNKCHAQPLIRGTTPGLLFWAVLVPTQEQPKSTGAAIMSLNELHELTEIETISAEGWVESVSYMSWIC
jgi:hypothetical protein